jgi:hypothetical protein
MNKERSTYQSYLVRFWRMDNAGKPVWRASLQEPGSATQLYFASLADLCLYLAAQLEGGDAALVSNNKPAGNLSTP